MKKRTLLTLLLLGISFAASAQYKQNSGRWMLGGSLGFGLDEDITSINVSPQLGYRITNSLTAGIGFSYNYNRDRDREHTLNYAGMNFYLQLMPVRYIKLFVQPEMHRRWGKTYGEKSHESTFGCMLVGGGLVLPIENGGISLNFYYDLIQNAYTPYKNKVMCSVGYTFSF